MGLNKDKRALLLKESETHLPPKWMRRNHQTFSFPFNLLKVHLRPVQTTKQLRIRVILKIDASSSLNHPRIHVFRLTFFFVRQNEEESLHSFPHFKSNVGEFAHNGLKETQRSGQTRKNRGESQTSESLEATASTTLASARS